MKELTFFVLCVAIFFSCGKKKGCTNEWASNYDDDAIVDCCCEFGVEAIINDLIGTYEMKETCSGSTYTYQTEVTRNTAKKESILLSNFNNRGYTVQADWNSDEFRFINIWETEDCNITLTGSLHKASNKLFFVYAAFPENSCENNTGKTCEARSL